jgi:molybdenum cofactor biosynthesis enzyme MoaA
MPEEHYRFFQGSQLMSAEEIGEIAKIFKELGVTKIRLTGGEPLVRNDFKDILEKIHKLNVDLFITTNGILVNKYLDDIIGAKIRSINVSLDSLNPETFKKITNRDGFHRVWSNIRLLIENGFHVKVNVVAVRGQIENELMDFIELTRNLPLHIRFIEFMPFQGNNWNKEKVITANQMLEQVSVEYDIVKLTDKPHETSKKYKVIGHEGTFAFITTMSNQFCNDCNRLRLTADGKIKNCLFDKGELDVLKAFRNKEDIREIILSAVNKKEKSMGGQFEKGYEQTESESIINRSMIGIGG